MIINEVHIEAELETILIELRTQLRANNIQYLNEIRDTPDNIMVSCPYHKDGQERKPSAGLRKTDGIFHCFACGETHTLQEVISYCFGKYNDVVGTFGWQWILKNFATVEVYNRKGLNLDISRNKTSDANIEFVSEEELEQYRVYHPYMWKRKLTPEVVDIFDIGFDEFSQCLTFPIRDENGNCLFIARRSVNSKFFNYPQGAEKPVYGLYELKQLKEYPKEVIICESMIDALTCWAYGKYAVALNGLGNDLQYRQLNKMQCRKFILATDNDTAGKQARYKLRQNIKNRLITEYILPEGRKDINELSVDEFMALVEKF